MLTKKLTLSLLIVGLLAGIFIGLSVNVSAATAPIPSWIKNTALWWGQGQISDDEFIGALQYLVGQGILKIPASSTPPASTPPASTPPASTPPASTPPASGELVLTITSDGIIPSKITKGKYDNISLLSEIKQAVPYGWKEIGNDQFSHSDVFFPSQSKKIVQINYQGTFELCVLTLAADSCDTKFKSTIIIVE